MMGNNAGGMGAGLILIVLLSVTLIVAIVWMIVGMVTQRSRPAEWWSFSTPCGSVVLA
jgi:glycerol-3-phosphate acyltransferase PlsY